MYVRPDYLLQRKGLYQCKKCKLQKDEEEVVEAIKRKFPDLDLSKFVYKGRGKVSTFICHKIGRDGKEHGEFETKPQTLLLKQVVYGCKKCSDDANAKTTEEFIKEVREKFPNANVNLSKVKYINGETKVEMECLEKDRNGNIHGTFWVRPSAVLKQTFICHKCYVESETWTDDIFINKIREKFPDVDWDVSRIKYDGWDKTIEIGCPKHGFFLTTPYGFLRSRYGCQKCAAEAISLRNTKTTEEFVVEYRTKFPHRNISLEKFEYKGAFVHSVATCHEKYSNGEEHGDFLITPNNLLSGHGCPMCKQSLLEEETLKLLRNLNVKFVYHCNKNDLAWLGRQEFDFYLPEYNTVIECQGRQHYEPVDFAGRGDKWAEEEYQRNIERDRRKVRLCEENSIRLFYIHYDEDVEETLLCILKEIGILQ